MDKVVFRGKTPQRQLSEELGGPQSRSVGCGEERSLLSLTWNTGYKGFSSVIHFNIIHVPYSKVGLQYLFQQLHNN
jgi:hypothetical protein